MLSPGAAKKVIIHLNEDTSSGRDFLYSEIFNFLFERGISGASMIRPHAGFGSHHRVHRAGAGSVEGEHLPVRIEFVETIEAVDAILVALCDLVTDGVVEVQATTIVKIASEGATSLKKTVLILMLGQAAFAQTPGSELTLAEAKAFALLHNPRIQSAGYSAQAAQSVVKEVRSAKLPTLSGAVTGADAQHGTILAAGAVQTSSLYTRVASGIAVNQLVTDFGRTSSLTKSADLRARAQNMSIETTREGVLLQVEQAYFQALGAQAVQRAAQAAVKSREVTLGQVRALAESLMRSTLDVRFAEVALSQAQLDLYQTENNASEGLANLSAALGLDHAATFTLSDEPMPAALDANPEASIQGALQKRPELAALGLERDGARAYAEAEGRLKLPTISLSAVAGAIPAGDPRLPTDYSAAAVNVNIPIFNGGLFAARHAEAEQRASAVEADIRDLAIQVSREVNVAWLEANTAFRRLDVTTRLVQESNEALRLAQTRYEAGLGSIVELTQAQASQTAAQIQNASARYEYLNRRAGLDFATGVLQ